MESSPCSLGLRRFIGSRLPGGYNGTALRGIFVQLGNQAMMRSLAADTLARPILLALALGMALATTAAPGAEPSKASVAEPTLVGVGRIDITPPGPIRMNGFLVRKGESTGVRQPIWAKALAIGSDEEHPAILITTDLLGVSDEMVQQLAARLHEKAGIDPKRVSVTATHTHSGPMVNGVAPNIFGEPIPPEPQGRIDRYTAELAEKLETVALAALKDRRPARLSWGIGRAGFAINRRARGKAGPVDHDLPTLAVHDLDGKLRAIYVSYACHCVTLSDTEISGDWAGYAMEHIERLHPGVTALISVGCGADSNPSSGVVGSKFEIASQQGVEIATAVDRLLTAPLRPVTGPLTIEQERIDLDLDKVPTRAEFVEMGKRTDPTGYFARVQVEKLDRGETLRTKISYPITTWAFGDSLAMVFLPGEVVVDFSLRLKRELDGRRVWVNAYANAAPCYIPSERVLKEGGYEGGGAMIYYDQPTKFAPGLEQKIIDAVRKPLEGKFLASVDPAKTQGSRPPAPEESLLALKTLPGLTVDLVVAEPLVTSPVAIDFGPDGRLWVCEMYDYPQGLDGNFQPGGRVRAVRDTDGDGRFDTSEVFLEGIPFPTGVTVWRKGVLVCAAPDILYAEDTDGDGRADLVRKLFSGFGTENFQARVNSLEYGLDGWVYGSCGLFGGEITNDAGKPPVALGNRDFRIRPDTGEIEPATGRTQQGRPRDDYGNWFGCDNSNFARHYPLADHDLRRNPHIAPPASAASVPADAEANRFYQAAAQLQLFKLSGQGGKATAACGIGVYRDDLLGANLRGDLFTCEPVGLVVHHLSLKPRGSTFAGERPAEEAGKEFLASTNNWFRPVQARTGPDGALWVVDMSRFVIEHPRWIPEESLAQVDVRAGHDMGRIYRVRPADQPVRSWKRLDTLDGPGLAEAIDSSNGWQRDLATQMLLWRKDQSAAKPLAKIATESTRPEARVQALCALDGLGQLGPDLLLTVFEDKHASVRRHAVRCAESRVGGDPQLQAALSKMSGEMDPQVRLQLAVSLGAMPGAEGAEMLVRLATHPDADALLRGAVLSSLNARNAARTLAVALTEMPSPKVEPLVGPLLATALAVATPAELAPSLQRITTPVDGNYAPWQWRGAAAICDALSRKDSSTEHVSLQPMFEFAEKLVADDARPEADRLASMALLGRSPARRDLDVNRLAELLTPRQPPAIQQGAVAALGRIGQDRVADLLLEGWRTHSAGLKNQILDLLLDRPAWQPRLVAALEAGTVAAASIDLPRRQRLLALKDEGLQKRAEKALGQSASPDRQKVLDAYRPALAATGDAARGKTLFAKSCSVCHRLEGAGHVVGPDLAALAAKTPQFLLQEILDPNRNVDSRYVSYVAISQDGQTLNGLLVAEASSSITLQGPEDRRTTLLRTDIDELVTGNKSLMPEGFEKDISPQQMADLLTYLTSSRPPRRMFEGNAPAVVSPASGELRLLAMTAELYGEQIVFEGPFQNIGYWSAPRDYAVWNVKTEAPADWDVWLDWSCGPDAAGNEFILEGGAASLSGKVDGTGGWDRYRQTRVGTIQLAAGTHAVTLRPVGPTIRGALMDLRGVHLVPVGKNPAAIAPPK